MLERRIRLAVAVLAAMTLAGCASHIDGSARPGEIDVRTLDVGNYNTQPLEMRYIYHHNLSDGFTLAQMRLSAYVATGPDIDPRLASGTGAMGLSDPSDATEIMGDASAPVLDRDGMLFGFATTAAEKVSRGAPAKDGISVRIAVLQFPDDAAAANAAADLEAADFAVAPDANQPVALTKYSAAHSHWRPGIPTLGSFLAHGSYVISVLAAAPAPDQAELADLTQRVYDTQIPLLDELKPLDREGILRLENDPDDMLRRTLNLDGLGSPSMITQLSVEARGFLHKITDRAEWSRKLTAFGVDRFALSGYSSQGQTLLFRARDHAAATDLRTGILDKSYPGPVDAPPGVPDSVCGESTDTADYSAKRYRCALTYDRYTAIVESDQLSDIHQRAAAQYALLANSTY